MTEQSTPATSEHHGQPDEQPDDQPAASFYIAGVGASAGGLEALRELFAAVAPDCGIAFVVQQHLSPDFESHMVELLARSTSLPVEPATDGLQIQPNRIYVAPPKKEMIVSGQTLLLTDRDPSETFSLPINHFFRSLALSVGDRAIGIILSGTGSDGTRGLRAIHEAGGLTVCQRPNTARFDGMLRNALGTGLVDLTLPPEHMGAALARFAKGGALGDVKAEELPLADGTDRQLFSILRRSHGIDFTLYKPATILRRLERRVQLAGEDSVEDYVQRLQRDPAELEALYKDLLIGVTSFFRDPQAFELTRSAVLPNLIDAAHERDGELRVWVAGCATGEEAYTIAILVDEALEQAGYELKVRIFATDVHRRSVEFASQGVYPESALENIPHQRREKYFKRTREGQFQVSKDLRSKVVFATHDVVTDAPFTKLDLVSCRNLLIYLQPGAQKKVLSLFHFGLRPDGCLMLGCSETPGVLLDEFEPISAKQRLYRKRRDIRLPIEGEIHASSPLRQVAERPDAPKPAAQLSPREGGLMQVYDKLLTQYMPAALLVDEEHRLLHVFGSADSLLQLGPGRISTDVTQLLHPYLRTAASSALQRCEQTSELVRYAGIRAPDGDCKDDYVVSAERIERDHGLPPAFLLRFERAVSSDNASGEQGQPILDAAEASRDYIRGLEADLQFSRENLQATIEELETSNEELQAANEELVASNEELQSTNEELNSVNEELNSVNTEHQLKISELLEVTEELNSLLAASDLGILFIDEQLQIKRFTPSMATLLHLREGDEGRKLADFARNVKDMDMVADVRKVLAGHGEMEREICDDEGRYHVLRVLPHPAPDNIQGALITLFDIDRRKRAEMQMHRLSSITENASDAILAEDRDGNLIAWNDGAEKLYGYTAEETENKPIAFLIPEAKLAEQDHIVSEVLAGRAVKDLETQRRRKDGALLDVSLTVSPLKDEEGTIIGASSIARDISDRKREEKARREAEQHKDSFLAMLSHELRNPLMGLLAAAEMLCESDGEHDRTLATDVIHRQTGHMAALLRDLFDVSRVRQGKFSVAMETLDLREALNGPLDVARARVAEKRLNIELSVPEQPVYVQGDITRLRQVATNLLDNAIEHSDEGDTIRVTVETCSDSHACFSVADEGDGMDPDTQSHVFEPFYQGGEEAGHGSGLGLGLALVHSIAEAHGGEIRVESDGPGRGTRFEIVLSRAEKTAQPRSRGATGSVDKLRVLLVEDEEDNRMLTALSLKRRGYSVRAVPNVREAREALDDEIPDVVLADLGLPDGSGNDVAEYARSRSSSTQPLLIALSGHAQPQDRQDSHTAGFDHHLVKPAPIGDVCHYINAHYPERAPQPD